MQGSIDEQSAAAAGAGSGGDMAGAAVGGAAAGDTDAAGMIAGAARAGPRRGATVSGVGGGASRRRGRPKLPLAVRSEMHVLVPRYCAQSRGKVVGACGWVHHVGG